MRFQVCVFLLYYICVIQCESVFKLSDGPDRGSLGQSIACFRLVQRRQGPHTFCVCLGKLALCMCNWSAHSGQHCCTLALCTLTQAPGTGHIGVYA